jgi:hypothetical protein
MCFVRQDEISRRVGENAEEKGFEWLRAEADKSGLVLGTKWVSKSDSAAGYDVEVDGGVFMPEWKGRTCFVEIKGTRHSEMKHFAMSSNERKVMMSKPDGEYVVLIVSGVDPDGKNAASVVGWLQKSDIQGTMTPSQYDVLVDGEY